MGKTPETAKLLRSLREDSGLSLRQTASELGVDPSLLSRIERGERPAGEAFSRRVAGYYGVDAEVIELNEGRIPPDVLAILNSHPEILNELRGRFSEAPEDES